MWQNESCAESKWTKCNLWARYMRFSINSSHFSCKDSFYSKLPDWMDVWSTAKRCLFKRHFTRITKPNESYCMVQCFESFVSVIVSPIFACTLNITQRAYQQNDIVNSHRYLIILLNEYSTFTVQSIFLVSFSWQFNFRHKNQFDSFNAFNTIKNVFGFKKE